jgi:hypothetical protein
MNSRQRVEKTLRHEVPDYVPFDLGGGSNTGMHASSVYLLRQALKLDPPGTPVKVIDPYGMCGEIKLDLVKALGGDIVPLLPPRNVFGYPNEDWKPWELFDSTPVLVPGGFNTEPEPDGDILMYPCGDHTAPPSARMPKGGFYFDSIPRNLVVDDQTLKLENNLEEFVQISDADISYYQTESKRLFEQTDKAILATFGGTAFGDVSLLQAPGLRNPKGIRDVAEWYMSLAMRKEFVWRIFEYQCEVGLRNLQRIHEVIGERITVMKVSGTDFGAQNNLLVSPKVFRELYLPFYKQVNNWVHQNTTWKTYIHSCGSVVNLLPDFINAGFDIFNPIQTSAAGMDPQKLKDQFSDCLVFWGGGIDTQQTLPYASPSKIREEVEERINIFGKGGGFIFATIHNVQPGIPVENLMALFDSFQIARKNTWLSG